MLRGNEEGISFESTGDTDNGKNRDLENSRGYGHYGYGGPKGPKVPSVVARGKTDDKPKKRKGPNGVHH